MAEGWAFHRLAELMAVHALCGGLVLVAWYISDGSRNHKGNLLCDGRLTLSNAPEAKHFTVALIEN